MSSMDATDLKIVDLLQQDARLTQSEVAKKVGLSQPSVADRVRKLEESGVILGYTAKVDPRRWGRTSPPSSAWCIEHPKYFDAFASGAGPRRGAGVPPRRRGPESYLLKVPTRSTGTLDHLLVEQLRTIPGVTRTHTTIVLASIKEETS